MAKELPYLKFEPSIWDSGNIQMCSLAAKGLFIDVCSLYWIRLGEVPYALALHKHCNGNTTLLDELIKCEIISIVDDQIVIDWLDEQLSEFQETNEKRRLAANKRWSNTNAMQVHSNSNAIREEKRREEKRKVSALPTLQEFITYAKSKVPNLDQTALKLKYDSWVENGWKTGGDKPRKIKNWKTTLNNTIPYLPKSQRRNYQT